MSENTKIEWCDHTINFWWGCTKVSPACANCYAATWSHRLGKKIWGAGNPREPHLESAKTLALKLDRKAKKTNMRPRIFANSMSDWLDDEVPIQWLAKLLDTIRLTPHLDWLLLTKRPENFQRRMMQVVDNCDDLDVCEFAYEWLGQKECRVLKEIPPSPPANVWIGTTVENQEMAHKRIPDLLNIPARIRFISCEPLLATVNISRWLFTKPTGQYCTRCQDPATTPCDGHPCPWKPIHWVICGGESGSHARPMHPDWSRSLRDQCEFADISFFFKQWGEWLQYGELDSMGMECLLTKGEKEGKWHEWENESGFSVRIGKKNAGALLDGKEHKEFPKGGTP